MRSFICSSLAGCILLVGAAGAQSAAALAKAQHWREARERFEADRARLTDWRSEAMRKAVLGSVENALQLDLLDESLALLHEFIQRAEGSLNEVQARRALAKAYRRSSHSRAYRSVDQIRRNEGSPGQRIELKARDRWQTIRQLEAARLRLAALEEAAASSRERGPLRAMRMEVNFELIEAIRDISGPGVSWSWWDADKSDAQAAEEPPPDPAYEGSPVTGIPVGEDGVLPSIAKPETYRPGLGEGRKVLFLLDEVERLDDSPKRGQAARAALLRAKLARDRHGFDAIERMERRQRDDRSEPDSEPDFPDEVRPLKQTAGGAPNSWELADDEAWTLVNGRARRVKLPASESPLELWQAIRKQYPQGWAAEEAEVAIADFQAGRDKFHEALALYEAFLRNHPRSGRRREVLESVARIKASSLRLSSSTQAGLPGEAVRLRYSARNVRQIDFQAQRVDGGLRYYDELRRNADVHVGEMFSKRDFNGQEVAFNAREKARYFLGPALRWRVNVAEPGDHREFEGSVTAPPFPGAGFYLVTATPADGKTTVRTLVHLTDVAIVQKQSESQALLFLAHPRSGQPLAQQPVLGLTRPPLHGAPRFLGEFPLRTGVDGIVAWSPPDREIDGVAALVRDGRGGATFSYRHGGFGRRNDDDAKAVARVVTDRPVYRPGSLVRFRVWLREREGNRFLPPRAGRELQVTLSGDDGVAHLKLVTDGAGGASGDYQLPVDAKLGTWRFDRFESAGLDLRGSDSFRVEEYRKPEFEVTVTPAASVTRLGEPFQARIAAKYLFGAPVRPATVKYEVVRSRYEHDPPQTWAYDVIYGLRPESPYAYPWLPWTEPSARELWRRPDGIREIVQRGEAPLAEDGTLELTVDTAAAARIGPEMDHHYRIRVEVRDAGRRTVSGTAAVVAARQEFRAFVQSETAWFEGSGEAQVVLRTCLLDGTPVAASGELSARRLTFRGPKPADVQEEEVARWPAQIGQDGSLTLPARLESPGQYRLRFAARDGRGREVEASTMVWVLGPAAATAAWRTRPLELIPERATYRVGETARVLLVTGKPDAHVLFSDDESNGYMRSWRVVHGGRFTILEIPVTAARVPSFGIGATMVRDGALHEAEAKILVPPRAAQLEVRLQTDKPVYGPGETARLRVEVRDADGKPAQGEMVMRASDDALQAFAGEAPLALLSSFHGDRVSAGVVCASSLDWLNPGGGQQRRYERRRSLYGFVSPLGYSDAEPARVIVTGSYAPTPDPESPLAAAGGGGSPAPARLRENFADTAVWLPKLELRADGTAEAEFKLPDSATRWRFFGAGISPETAIGQAENTAQSTKPILVRLQAPRFFIERDEVTLSAIAHNDLPAAQMVRGLLIVPSARFEALGAGRGSAPVADEAAGTLTFSAEAEIPAGGQHRFDWRLRALQPGPAKVTVQALATGDSDAMQLELPILIHGVEKQVNRSGSFRAGQTGTRQLQFELPAEMETARSRLEITLTPSLAHVLVEALPFLIEYPYGCVEQTVSRFFPAAVVEGTLRRLGTTLEAVAQNQRAQRPPPPPGRAPVLTSAEPAKVTREGLERLAKLRQSSGGWGWWSEDDASVLQTAYVVHGLHAAAAAGVEGTEHLLQSGQGFLDRHVTAELAKPWRKRALGDATTQAFVAYVIGLTETPDSDRQRWLDELFRHRAELSHQGRALLVLALQRAGRSAQARLVWRNLEQFLERDETNETAWIRPNGDLWWHWFHNDAETSAWALRALLALEPKSELAPRLVKWLVQHRTGGGHWRSTRDTALIICAVDEYLRLSGEASTDATASVSFDGGPAEEWRFTQGGFAAAAWQVRREGAQQAPGAHTVTLTKAGAGPLYYSARLNFYTREPDIAPGGDDLTVERRYFKVAAGAAGVVQRVPLAPGDEVQSGQELEVVLSIRAKNNYEFLAFEDHKPAGCEPVELRSGSTYADGFCANVELRDTKVTFFVAELRQGAHELRYRVRAETPGIFRAPPTTAFAMYAPELRANSRTLRLQVGEAGSGGK